MIYIDEDQVAYSNKEMTSIIGYVFPERYVDGVLVPMGIYTDDDVLIQVL